MTTEEKIDAKYIIKALYRNFGLHNQIACHNTYFGAFESDFIYMTMADYVYEVEVKISKSDYKQDFKKEKSRWIPEDERQHPKEWTRTIKRHDELKNGETGYKGFYFALPEELADLLISDEYAVDFILPDHCGLLSVGRWVKTLVKAPLLPRAKKFETSDYIRMMAPHYHKSIRNILRGKLL